MGAGATLADLAPASWNGDHVCIREGTVSVRVVVVGAGIGGLSAATALCRRGVDVEVLEARPELSEVGAGLTLWPNALAGLARLGLEGRVAREGHEIRSMQVRRRSGRRLSDIDTAQLSSSLGHPSVGITRPRLHRILAEAAQETGAKIHVGSRCLDLETTDDAARVCVEDGTRLDADVVIGADGLNSSVRRHLHRDTPTFAGVAAWRAICEAPLPADGPDSLTWRAPGQLAGAVRQRNGSFWYATRTAPYGGYRIEDAHADLLSLFGTWDQTLVSLITSTPPTAIHLTHLYDRRPRRGVGPITLLGDAAHPMRPSLGQGACQAIEDALVLADRLTDGKPEPLRRYEAARRRRVARLVRFSRWTAATEQVEQPLLHRLFDTSFALAPTRTTTAIFGRFADPSRYP